MKLRKTVAYVSSFALARGGLFFAPIMLANILPVEQYGALEIAQSLAALAALVVGLGLPHSAPLILLRDEILARWDTLLWIIIMISGAAMMFSLALSIAGHRVLGPWVLVPLTLAILLTQGLWSAVLK